MATRIVKYLTPLVTAYGPPIEGTTFIWPADFVLRHGYQYRFASRPADVKAGRAKYCFRNAYRLALLEPERFIYVEGYYAWKTLRTLPPIDHAWCVDARTLRVVDPTCNEGGEYLGVPFRLEYLCRIALEGGDFGVINNLAMDSPLLTGEHTVEEAIELRGYPRKRRAKAIR